LLNSYEYYKSYQNIKDEKYEDSYLNIGYDWWLLNNYDSDMMIWTVSSNGLAEETFGITDTDLSVRSSIILKSTIKLFGGTGTLEDPYRLDGDIIDAEVNTTLLNTRVSGEYVNFDEKNIE